jgi:hypothetical protein
MPDSNHISQVDRRSQTIKSLRTNAAQATSWQVRFVDLLEELHKDNIALRRGYADLKARIETLERERIAV